MKQLRCLMAALGVVCFMSTGLPETASAQQAAATKAPAKIRKIKGDKVKTPRYSLASGNVSGRSRDWFQISTEYETEPEWLDELKIQYYVLAMTKSGKKEQSLFRGEVNYVNVEEGKHMSVMYLHPSTLSRYGDVQAVAVLLYAEGRLLGAESEPSTSKRWWEQMTPRDGFLLNRMETPFAMINFDNYEAIKGGAK